MRLAAVIASLFFLILSTPSQAQSKKDDGADSLAAIKLHSPHKASIYSAVLPGLGQAYNKKYWKIPIVYAGVGTITYFALDNRKEFRIAKEAFNYVSGEHDYPIDNKYVGRYSASDLITIRDYYRRNMELSWILLGAWYLLNIVDATVDAHLFYYDVSDELSLELFPVTPNPIEMPIYSYSPKANFFTLKFSL